MFLSETDTIFIIEKYIEGNYREILNTLYLIHFSTSIVFFK
jgi:hypothetical protein